MPADTLIETLSYFEKMLPSFFSDRAQFTITFPNMANVWQEEHPDAEVHIEENDVPQGVPQVSELDKWIEKQIIATPKITTEELAKQANVTSKTIKRHIAKMANVKYVGSGYSGHWEVEK